MGIAPRSIARLLLNPPLSDSSGVHWLNPQRVAGEAAWGCSDQMAATSDRSSAPAPMAAPAARPVVNATNTVERCLSYDDSFLPYKETGQHVRDIIKKALEKGNALPKKRPKT